MEAGRNGSGEAREFGDALRWQAGVDLVAGAKRAAVIGAPVVGQGGEFGFLAGATGSLLSFEEFLLHAGGLGRGIDAYAPRIELVEGGMVLDGGVAARLGDGWVVDLAVAMAAIADEVDDDIGVEAMAEFGDDGCDTDDSVGVLSVDVEDGDGKALGYVRGEAGGVGLLGQGGEAEEVVDNDVDGAADLKTRQCSEDQAFGEDALAGERGVAVHADGEYLVAASLIGAI